MLSKLDEDLDNFANGLQDSYKQFVDGLRASFKKFKDDILAGLKTECERTESELKAFWDR